MASAIQLRAALAPATDDELTSARECFIEVEADKLLNNDMTGLFDMLNGEQEVMLQVLFRGKMVDIVFLAERFRTRMEHEARAAALRAWTATEEAKAIHRIQDGRVWG